VHLAARAPGGPVPPRVGREPSAHCVAHQGSSSHSMCTHPREATSMDMAGPPSPRFCVLPAFRACIIQQQDTTSAASRGLALFWANHGGDIHWRLMRPLFHQPASKRTMSRPHHSLEHGLPCWRQAIVARHLKLICGVHHMSLFIVYWPCREDGNRAVSTVSSLALARGYHLLRIVTCTALSC